MASNDPIGGYNPPPPSEAERIRLRIALEDTDIKLSKLLRDVEMFVDARGMEALRQWQAEVRAALKGRAT